MQLSPHHVDIWSIDLAMSASAEQAAFTILSNDEQIRANRFKFTIHRQRFIAARSSLRSILSLYLHDLPEKIEFAYTTHQKPYLKHPQLTLLNFNLAHSDNKALYAIAFQQKIGIDIEKIKPCHQAQIAKRYFTQQENTQLNSLPQNQQLQAFYECWAKKEAVIKAAGLGLALPLSSFSVSILPEPERVQTATQTWFLYSLPIDPAFKAAVASDQIIHTWSHWTLTEHQPAIINKNNKL